MGKHTTLTREDYANKFNEQMSRFNYIPQDGEHIKQCEAPYPDYWFASDKGYVFTACVLCGKNQCVGIEILGGKGFGQLFIF